MSMFCFQCQETAGGKGYTTRGVCGKNEKVAKLQDLLTYTLKGVSEVVVKGGWKQTSWEAPTIKCSTACS